MVYKSVSEKDTQNIAKDLAEKLVPGQVVAFVGELGAGKTTFIRYLAEALGFTGRVQSPTFVVHRVYAIQSNPKISRINHLDLYRFDDPKQLEVMDFDEYFSDKNAITFIEWPQIADNILPKDILKVNIKIVSETEREISYELQSNF